MLKRIILHWTAGTNNPNPIDLIHYHYLIDKAGEIIEGKFKPEDNIKCDDNKYAAHTGGGNTGSIGIAVCGMLGFQNKLNIGNYPVNNNQIETMCALAGRLCVKYGFKVNTYTILTHYEFGLKNKNTDSYGKIDISWLPTEPPMPAAGLIGDYLRRKIRWYYLKEMKEFKNE